MQRSLLLVCILVLFARQSLASEIDVQKPPGARPRPVAEKSESRGLEQTVSTAPQMRHAMRDETNGGLVGIISRGMEGTELWEATDLAASLHGAQDHLRILPIAGEGGVQNVTDIVFARGVDIGIIQSDALDGLKHDPLFPGIEKYLHYITKLYDEELHNPCRRRYSPHRGPSFEEGEFRIKQQRNLCDRDSHFRCARSHGRRNGLSPTCRARKITARRDFSSGLLDT